MMMYEIADMESIRPQLRDGLILMEPSSERTGLIYHEQSGRIFKVSDQTYDLFALFDGQRSLPSITALYNEQQSSTFKANDIYDILKNKFEKLVALDYDSNSELLTLKTKTPSYLKLSTIVAKADLVEKIAEQFKYFFNKKTIVLFTTLFVVLCIAAVLKHGNNLKLNDIAEYSRHWKWYVLLIMISSIWHELGHASACRYYNVRHGGIGVGFYLFTPVMFADVTAAWLLPPRQRIVINFGGIYFELIFAVFLITTSFIVNSFLLVSACLFILVKLVYNLNPFFRTDGYWVLSDAIGIHNLRQKSNDALKQLVVNLFQGRSIHIDLKSGFLISYSVISWSFIAAFVWFVLFVFDGSLIYFPVYLYELAADLITGSNNATQPLSIQINRILVPVFFYYLLIRMIISYVPAIAKFIKHSVTKEKPQIFK